MKSTLVELPPDVTAPGEAELADYLSEPFVEESADAVARPQADGHAVEAGVGDGVFNRVLLPNRQFGPYHILGFVAAGGMGEIYAAQRLMPDGTRSRPLALKVITAEYSNDWRIIERFKREAMISRSIRSPHVVRVYEFGESLQGHAFLAMDLLRGEELFDRLHRKKILLASEVADIALQILEGLHAIHQAGFVHRDIKPENIFIARDADGRESVKILDFGIARRLEQTVDPMLSVAGQIFGTPQYLAPEQATDPDVDERADIYSLGVLMFECVTGNLPFDGETAYALILAHQSAPVPRLPLAIDPAFAEIIYRAMAKDPLERFQSAREMAAALERWIETKDDGFDLSFDLEGPELPPLDFVFAPGEASQPGLAAPAGQASLTGPGLAGATAAEGAAPAAGNALVARGKKGHGGSARGDAGRRTVGRHDEDDAEAPGSLLPHVVTLLALIVLLAAVVWSILSMGE